MANSIRWFDTVDSTNTQLMNEKGGLPDRQVYAALFQTAGQGQPRSTREKFCFKAWYFSKSPGYHSQCA